MLYNFNGTFINLTDISSMHGGSSNDSEYPHTLTIYMKSGQSYSVKYRQKAARDNESRTIAGRVLDLTPIPLSRFEVQTIVQNEVEKARRDFRRLRETIKEGTL